MIVAKDMSEAVALFCQNPYWQEYYDGAVSERLQEWVGCQFLLSQDPECLDEVVAAMKRLEEEFTVEEWEYVYKYTGNNPFKGSVRRKIEALRANG